MKATAQAHANVGLIKYWGRKNEILRLPQNGSISVNLSGLTTTTTVEFDEDLTSDEIIINGEYQHRGNRVSEHLNRIRNQAGIKIYARVESINSFPSSTGLSSSSSGFAALTLAGSSAAGLSLTEKELSILARQGSGSASRSIPSGFVEWLNGDISASSYAVSIFPENYWKIIDVVAIVSAGKKEVSSADGQKLAGSSPFFETRLSLMKDKISVMKEIIQKKDFRLFGEMIESEALEMHAVMLTSQPSLIYWSSGTLELMKLVRKWRSDGLSVYFTINTGQDIHLFCENKNYTQLPKMLEQLNYVKKIIINYPAGGARIINKHLF